VEEAEHGRAAVLDLHDLEAAHVLGLDEAKRVVHAQRQGDANVALREHGGADGARWGLKGRRLERGRLHGKSGDHDYDCEQKGGQDAIRSLRATTAGRAADIQRGYGTSGHQQQSHGSAPPPQPPLLLIAAIPAMVRARRATASSRCRTAQIISRSRAERPFFIFVVGKVQVFLVTDEFQAGLVRVILSVFSQPNLCGAVLDLT
jgi:hypothetical protein